MIATDPEKSYGGRYKESLRLSSTIKGQLELASVRALVTRHTATPEPCGLGGGTARAAVANPRDQPNDMECPPDAIPVAPSGSDEHSRHARDHLSHPCLGPKS